MEQGCRIPPARSQEVDGMSGYDRIEVHDLDVRNITDLPRAFDLAIKERVEALRVSLSGITRTNKRLVIDLAAQHKLPAIYLAREFVENGGLISYGVSYPDLYLRAASFVSKILNGRSRAISPWSNRLNSSWSST